MYEKKFDIDRLRKDMKDDYGTAMMNGFPTAMMDLSKVESSTPEELLRMAQERGVDLGRYEK